MLNLKSNSVVIAEIVSNETIGGGTRLHRNAQLIFAMLLIKKEKI